MTRKKGLKNMEKNYIFGSEHNGQNSSSIPSDMMYVYSPICKEFKTFTLGDDCIHNVHSNAYKAPYDYQYVSAVTVEKYTVGTEISTTCDFESYGAPLIVFSDDIRREGAHFRYGAHYEVVAYEGGCNVWYIVPEPEREERPIRTSKIAFKQFEIKNGERIEMSVRITKGKLTVLINGQLLEVQHDSIPEAFHVGITACEGLNRFYDFRIGKINE